FENHAKVDFSFHPLSLLENMVSTKKLNQTYDAGYQVLLDKDGITGQLPKPSFQAYRIARPTEHEFENCQNEFWFESYHVAKYIMRFDLWAAKIRDHDMKKWLLAMLEWNAATRSNFTLSIKREGKYISDWIHPAYKSRMGACFAGWDALAQHSALMASLDLFRTVAKETASLLDYAYKEKPDQNLSNYIATLIPYTDGQSPL
ncbi:MAG TPA: aminoglycoside 6-adenylyltransferase, partial [Puia sp.]|nr:aminoglycoside 6-adenylyltransferase [Puia sp.]